MEAPETSKTTQAMAIAVGSLLWLDDDILLLKKPLTLDAG